MVSEKKKRKSIENELREISTFNESKENEKYELEKKLKISEYNFEKLNKDFELKNSKYEKLKNDFETLQKISEELKNKKVEKSDEIVKLETKNSQLSEKLKKSLEDLSIIKEELTALDRLNKKMEKDYKNLFERNKDDVQEYRRIIEEKEAELAKISSKNNSFLEEKAVLETQNKELKNSIERLKNEVEIFKKRANDYNLKIEKFSKENFINKNNLENVKVKIKNTLNNILSNFRNEVDEIRIKIRDFRHFKTYFSSNMLNKIDQMKNLILDKEMENKTISSDFERVSENLKEMNQRIQNRDHENFNLRNQIELKEQSNNDLMMVIEQLKANSDHIKTSFSKEISTLKQISKEVERRSEEKAEIMIQGLKDKFEETEEILNHQINSLKTALFEEKKANSDEKKELESQILIFEQKFQKMIEDMRTMKTKYNQLKQKNVSLNEKLLIVESKSRTKLISLENENNQLKKLVDNFHQHNFEKLEKKNRKKGNGSPIPKITAESIKERLLGRKGSRDGRNLGYFEENFDDEYSR